MALGKVDVVVLGLLAQGPVHGYDLLERFRARGMGRWVEIGRASVYQALRRLEREGLVVGRDAPGVEGPERRVYRLTRTGREHLRRDLPALAGRVGPYEGPGGPALGFLRLLPPSEARAAVAGRERGLRELVAAVEAEAAGTPDPVDRAMLGLQAALVRAELDRLPALRRALGRAPAR